MKIDKDMVLYINILCDFGSKADLALPQLVNFNC